MKRKIVLIVLGLMLVLQGANIQGMKEIFADSNVNLSSEAKWKSDNMVLDQENYDTVQTSDNFLFYAKFKINREETNKSVSVNIPKGIQVVSQTNATNSITLSGLDISGSHQSDEGTTLKYILKEGVSADVAVQIELKNAGAYIYGPGTPISINSVYNYEIAGEKKTLTDQFKLTVKPFDFKLNKLENIHRQGNDSADVGSIDSLWYEKEALENSITQSEMIVLDTNAGSGRDRQSPIKDITIKIPLPSQITYKGVEETLGLNKPNSKYDYSYDVGTHTLTLTLQKDGEGFVKKLDAGTNPGAGVYDVMLPLIISKVTAQEGDSYIAPDSVKYSVTDAGDQVHSLDTNQKVTIQIYERNTGGQYAVPTMSPKDFYVTPDNTVVIAEFPINNLSNAQSFTDRPKKQNNGVFEIQVPDGLKPKKISLTGFDVRPIHTPTNVIIEYKTKDNNTFQTLGTIDTKTKKTSNQSISLDFPALAGSDVVTGVQIKFDTLGTFIGNNTKVSLQGSVNTHYRDGNSINDGDTKQGKLTFTSDEQETPSTSIFDTTYHLLTDKLTVNAKGLNTSTGTYGANILLQTKDEANMARVDVLVNNPEGGILQNNVRVKARILNGVEVKEIGKPSIPSFTSAQITLDNGEVVDCTSFGNQGYVAPEGRYIKEIVYYANSISAGYTGSGNAIKLPMYVYTPHGTYNKDGENPDMTNVVELSVTGDDISEENKLKRILSAFYINDKVEYKGFDGYGNGGAHSTLTGNKSSATPGDGSVIQVNGAFNLALNLNSSAYASVDTLNKEYVQTIDKLTVYYKLNHSFDYVSNSVNPSIFGGNTEVSEEVVKGYFPDGDDLIQFTYTGFKKEIPATLALNPQNIEFKVAVKPDATSGEQKIVKGYWYEIDKNLIGTEMPNKTGKGTVSINGNNNGYYTNIKDVFDVNENNNTDEYLGKPDYRDLGPTITLNERREAGVFSYGSSMNNKTLGAGPYDVWENETFNYYTHILANVGYPLNNFVAYIPVNQKSGNTEINPNGFDIELAQWPTIPSKYTVAYSENENATMNDLVASTKGTDEGYFSGVPTDLSKVKMIKISATNLPIGTNDLLEFKLKLSGEKPVGPHSGFMTTFFNYDEKSGNEKHTDVVEYKMQSINVSGSIWLDKDYDGVKTSADQRLSDVTVMLFDQDNLLIPVMIGKSNSKGEYVLEGKSAKGYKLKVKLPDGKRAIPKNQDTVINPSDQSSDLISLDTNPKINQNIGLADTRGIISVDKLTLKVGESFELTGKLAPEYLSGVQLKYQASTHTGGRVSVDDSGKVTGVAIGETYITISAPDGYGEMVEKRVEIQVKTDYLPPSEKDKDTVVGNEETKVDPVQPILEKTEEEVVDPEKIPSINFSLIGTNQTKKGTTGNADDSSSEGGNKGVGALAGLGPSSVNPINSKIFIAMGVLIGLMTLAIAGYAVASSASMKKSGKDPMQFLKDSITNRIKLGVAVVITLGSMVLFALNNPFSGAANVSAGMVSILFGSILMAGSLYVSLLKKMNPKTKV